MSSKATYIRFAVKWTPRFLILFVANLVLRGIGKLTDFKLDLDSRTFHARTLLAGEVEPIDLWVKEFYVYKDTQGYHVVVRSAESNKIWLTNMLTHVVGRAWTLPSIPQLNPHLDVVAEVLEAPLSLPRH